MAVENITRNLRDGELVVKDGNSTPNSVTLVLDNGDLRATINYDTKEIKDRGVLHHTRPGDQQSGDISYSLKWVQLIGDTVTGSSDPAQYYELITNRHSTYKSTDACGSAFTTKHEFTVASPCGTSGNGEKITFLRVYPVSVELGEGDEFNTISFTGKNFEVAPLIERV